MLRVRNCKQFSHFCTLSFELFLNINALLIFYSSIKGAMHKHIRRDFCWIVMDQVVRGTFFKQIKIVAVTYKVVFCIKYRLSRFVSVSGLFDVFVQIVGPGNSNQGGSPTVKTVSHLSLFFDCEFIRFVYIIVIPVVTIFECDVFERC